MSKIRLRFVSLVLALTVILSVGTVTVGAVSIQPNSLGAANVSLDSDGRLYPSLKGIANKKLGSYERLTVTVGSKTLSVKGFVANGVAYIPFRAASSAISGSKYDYTLSTKTSVMKANGLELTATDGCYVTYANGRVLFNTTPNVIMNDGRLYIPANVFAKAVGMKVSIDGSRITISGSYSPLVSADKFYSDDEVFWLARIIHAESRGEPLIGQIAVGNVVLNRVRSAYYPNTIYGVIFDRKYGVQFSPVLDGTIYNTPGYSATLAAKICLEGYDLSGGAFFFLNVKLATSSWIPLNREYAYTIGNHDFYK